MSRSPFPGPAHRAGPGAGRRRVHRPARRRRTTPEGGPPWRTSSISGAVSGLDTQSIINSLVSVQANQQTLLQTQQSTAQKRLDAYTSLITSLNSLAAQATAARRHRRAGRG